MKYLARETRIYTRAKFLPKSALLVGLVCASLSATPVFAQKNKNRGGDPWLLAQQAFTRLDYSSAYKYANEVLQKKPTNVDARRIAAKSAKELGRFQDCLKLMGGLPVKNVTPDDVGLVGECSADSPNDAWTMNFLQQNLSNSANHDIASYWLGRTYYKRSEYPKAEKLLSSITVLPARLEKDRVFMLSRIKEISQVPSAAVAPANRAPYPVVPPQPAPYPMSPAQQPQSPYPPVPSRNDLASASRGESSSRDSGGFLIPDAAAEVIFTGAFGEQTKIGNADQRKYDEAPVSTPEAQKELIERDKTNESTQQLNARIGGKAGYKAVGTSENGAYVSLAVRGLLGASVYKEETRYFNFMLENSAPHSAVFEPNRGAGVLAGAEATAFLNRYIGAVGTAEVQRVWPGFRDKGASLVQSYGGKLVIEGGPVHFDAGAAFSPVADKRGVIGLNRAIYSGNLNIDKIGIFSLRPPAGYNTFRYSIVTPTAKKTPEILLFVGSEGKFLELNIAPRLHIRDTLSILAWYHFKQTGGRSYVSPSKADRINAEIVRDGGSTIFNPSAMYSEQFHDAIMGLDFSVQQHLTILTGASLRMVETRFTNGDADTADPTIRDKYKVLLNGNTQDKVVLFADVVLKL